MKVILKKFVKNVGRAGDQVDVSDGYAKNFLLKQNLAVVANAENVNINNQQKRAEEKARAEALAEATKIAKEIDNIKIVIKATTGANGNLFGSITNKEIAEELNKLGYNVDKRKIELSQTIKILGEYKIVCKLHPGVNAKFLLVVEN